MRYVIEYLNNSNHWELSGNYLSTDPVGTPGRRHIRDFDFPSLEAAQREATYQQGRSSMQYRARDTQPDLGVSLTEGASMHEGVASTEPVAQPRAVRIYRRNREWIVDTGGREVPVMASLTPYLPGSLKLLRNTYYTVLEAVQAGVSPQMMTSALAAWYTERPNTGGRLTLENGASEIPDNRAYLAFGDHLYQMVPVRQISSSKAIRVMRERARVEVEQIREGLRRQASAEAQQVIAQANQRAAAIRSDAEREKLAQSTQLRFPEWLRGHRLFQDINLVNFSLEKVTITFASIAHGERRWQLKEGVPRSVAVLMWLPLSGNPELVHLFSSDGGSLPHVSTDSACMKIGETVLEINSYDRLLRFQGQVARALSIINLASLLNSNFVNWMPQVQALIPDGIKKWLELYTSRDYQSDAEYAAKLPATTILERQEETWSVRSVR